MRINGACVGKGFGRDIIDGHPLEALAWLLNKKAASTESGGVLLRAGHIVMLGSVVQTKWVEEGDVVEVELDGLGKCTAHFNRG